MTSGSLFRSMRSQNDGRPRCGPTARTLGVRVPRDVRPDEQGCVHPATGGMSVAPDDPMSLAPHRRPRTLAGTGADPVFELKVHELGAELALRRDRLHHALVEPSEVVSLDAFQGALCDTGMRWRLSYEHR